VAFLHSHDLQVYASDNHCKSERNLQQRVLIEDGRNEETMNDTNVRYHNAVIPHGTNVRDRTIVRHPEEGRTSNYADLEHDNIIV